MGDSLPLGTLVLGGARSGKSRFAERLAESQAGPCLYLATAEAGDEEMQARIAAHRARRGSRWQTFEEPLELPAALARLAGPGRAVLVDCLTLWLSNLMASTRSVSEEQEKLLCAIEGLAGPAIFVSNEVGLGILPDNPLARRFCDRAGTLHQALAERLDSVVFLAAGLPLILKAPSHNGGSR